MERRRSNCWWEEEEDGQERVLFPKMGKISNVFANKEEKNPCSKRIIGHIEKEKCWGQTKSWENQKVDGDYLEI